MWLLKALLQGLVLATAAALISAFLVPLVADHLVSAFRRPSCSEPTPLVRLVPTDAGRSSELKGETTGGRQLIYGAGEAVDGDTGTAWVEGVPGLGSGQWIEFDFDGAPRVALLCIVNGYSLTWDLYEHNPRIRGMDITTERQSLSATLTDPGSTGHVAVFQDVRVNLRRVTKLRITITSAYAGLGRDRSEDTSLSEVEFWGER